MENEIEMIPVEIKEKSATIEEEQIEAPVVENSTENGKKINSTDVESVSENQSSEQIVQNADGNGCENVEEQKYKEKIEPEKQLMIPIMKVCAVDDTDNDTSITDLIEEETGVLPDDVNNIDESGLSPKSTTTNDDIPPNECEPFTIVDSDNPSECSPEKSQNSEKPNKIDLLSLLSSPSQIEPDDSFGQNQLADEIYDEEPSIDESNDDENDTDEDDERNDVNEDRPTIKKPRSTSTFKKNNDYPVFELTDDNSSEDDMRSDEDEEFHSDAQSMSSAEDIVHNIDDSDDEPEEKFTQNNDEISSPASAKYLPKETENRYQRNYYDDQEEERRYVDSIYTQRRNYIRDVLQKQSASKIYRYMAVKRSIMCLNNRIMRDSRGVNRMTDELNDDIKSGSTSEIIQKSPSIDASVLKERNANEKIEPTLTKSTTNESNAKCGKSTNEADNNKLNAHGASDKDADNKHNNNHQITSEIDVNDLTINLDLDDIDNNDDHLIEKKKCAKRIPNDDDDDDDDEDDNDDNELGMDVDDPSEELYLTEKTDKNRYDRLDADAKQTIKLENTVTIECEEDSSKSIGADENTVIMNGINKDGQSSDSTNANDAIENQAVKSSGKSNKRKLSISSDEDSEPPTKTVRTDMETNFPRHDKIIRRMIESSNSAKSNDPDTLQHDIDQLNSEIETLGEAARTKEIEWNNILYLKKMKEEMLLRLNRKRTIMEIMQSTKSIDNPESLFLNNNNFDNVNEMNAMESKQKTLSNVAPATSFIMSRCNMKSVDLAKEKSNLNDIHRNIQPKASQHFDGSATFSNVITSIPKSSPAMQFQTTLLQQRLRENGQSLSNSNNQITDQSSNKLQIGRQGQIKDVQSIIANFRQTHPEAVPRRGRRLKNVNQGYYMNEQGSAGDATDALVAEMLSKHNNDLSSPPTSNDSNYSNSQIMITKAGPSNHFAPLTPGNFKQAFNENNIIAGMSLKNSSLLTSTPLFKNQGTGIGYPEVTLHPIQSTMLQNQKHVNENMSDAHASSLLHGILTKKLKGSNAAATGLNTSNVNATGFNNAFSPTLARLLTAPERNIALTTALTGNSAGSSSNNNNNNHSNNSNNNNNGNNNNNNNNHFFTNQTSGINLSKSNSSRTHESKPEISCLPISQILALQQQQQQQLHQNNSLLQQQLQRNQRDINKLLPKNNVFNLDDEADDSDRLIIDEGDQYSNSEMIGGSSNKKDDSPDGELPECQGCKKREAQFVCADCKSQWYCSRECQVLAWDEHSEVCAR